MARTSPGLCWLAILIALPALGPAASAEAAGGTPGARIGRFIEEIDDLGLAPGMAVAVVQGDETILLQGYGLADVAAERPVTPETVFYIASSTKSFVGLLCALLQERGALDLDDTLARELPEARLGDGCDPAGITLFDLLTHTHGIANEGPVTFRAAYSGAAPHDRMVELLAWHGPAEHGREFQYGNIGYNIMGLVLEEKFGASWKDLLARDVLAPLGMRSTTGYVSRADRERLALPYRPGPEGFERLPYLKSDENMHAAGGLVTSAADLARWLRANLGRGVLDGKRVLPEAAFALAQKPRASQEASFGGFGRTGYALGWNTGPCDGRAALHDFGSFAGFFCHVSFVPELDAGVAVLVNDAYTGDYVSDAVARFAYDVLARKADAETARAADLQTLREGAGMLHERIVADRERRAARPQTLDHPLEAYAGTYQNPLLGRMTFTESGGQLSASMGPLRSPVEVYDAGEEKLRVELTGSGTVVAFLFGEGGTKARALRFMGEEFARVP